MRPVVWAIFTENGNIRIWSPDQEPVRQMAEREGLTITPLYTSDDNDSVRLSWLIENGAYGLIDHDSYPHTNLPELQDEIRRRIDFEMGVEENA